MTDQPNEPQTELPPEESLSPIQQPSRSLGQIGFEAYWAFTNGKTFDGRDIPAWKDLGDSVRGAWEDGAQAVKAALEG